MENDPGFKQKRPPSEWPLGKQSEEFRELRGLINDRLHSLFDPVDSFDDPLNLCHVS